MKQLSKNKEQKYEIEEGGRNQIFVSRDTTYPQQQQQEERKKIRVGYLSPDFTSTHPLAFLMQSIFQYHNRDDFEIYTYSLNRPMSTKNEGEDDEVTAIQKGSDCFKLLPPSELSLLDMAKQIQDDELHILVDLCGYAGTSKVAELMSLLKQQHQQQQQHFPVQISYMGFPGSSGAPYIDYMIVDDIVVPPPTHQKSGSNDNEWWSVRKWYTEGLIYMPHCYFVNSHLHCAQDALLPSHDGRGEALDKRKNRYGLPSNNDNDGFVFCCHSRPDKIDPKTFRVWLNALDRVRHHNQDQQHENMPRMNNAVLWLLKSCDEMEDNLRLIVKEEYPNLSQEALIFASIAERNEHLSRLACADLFLDTPSYNAHTLGCDALFVGVPMISLLRPDNGEREDDYVNGNTEIGTTKLASRVGASLLRAAGMYDEMVCEDMISYEELMVSCALNKDGWYDHARQKLISSREECPLFNTKRWVQNLELAFREIAWNSGDSFKGSERRRKGTNDDILILD